VVPPHSHQVLQSTSHTLAKLVLASSLCMSVPRSADRSGCDTFAASMDTQ
jgi:hypothetical protein